MQPQELLNRCVDANDFIEEPHHFRMGKNQEMINQINDNTRLIVVGTFIPNIPFFYTGTNNVTYGKLDERFDTNVFSQCKNEINNHLDNPREYIDQLKERLSEIGLVFFDAIEKANVHDPNGSSDENIGSAVIDDEMLKRLLEFQKDHPHKIIAASKFAKLVLDDHEINNYYPKHGLISGYKKANENWPQIFVEYLDDHTFAC